MTVKLSDDFKNARTEFLEAVKNGESQEVQGQLYSDMINELFEEARAQAKAEAEGILNMPNADKKLNAEQRKFFNEINKEVGYKEEKLIPQETIDRIFEDLTTAHPLLQVIGLKNVGLRLKFLKSETKGQAVWGKIHGEIKGQLDAAFSEEEAIQNKLTAFVVIPKDLKDFGPAWIESFVKIQIEEAFAVALEAAFLNGTGKDQPIGLIRQVQEGVSVSGGEYPKKDITSTLSFKDPKTTVLELTKVYKHHSINEKGKAVAVKGKVHMVVNPSDAFDIQAQYTHLNAQGVYVTALPFNLNIVESLAQVSGEVTTFVEGRYHAYLGGGINIKKFDQTLALEDLELYTAKQFAYGKAFDNKAAAVHKLALATSEPVDSGETL
ncbi:TPA: phage major capsid protein [Staphylococcus argenteus]|uniref:Phage capsid-like C-terminal domain-containing protein n=1 Tax=Staphylococcus argenteus TaxID=985002 RepID=A0A7U7PWJ2_9STAP|nr:phage major capsid protein [Staphylococcus argenteus]MDI1597717.1 phage major capsid protein [Staphylococcus aureus]EKF1505493.1 phage major capsid protein [Staphylococcus argenteus]EYG86211.1 HK97 family phage major capsid protein [Staphylococcus argenteus]EYL85012.1 HK97 family phage major capsid protein [Staphylococcus argenteus]KAA0799303.1 phage major capsid protein [Staphylococcus argenteus]